MNPTRPAYGGVVIDAEGRVLLREQSHHFDRYVWTFPKGRPNEGESGEETALRETREETGVVAEIVQRIPGTFAGGTTENIYFIMRSIRDSGGFDEETASVRWADPADARALILETTNDVGRVRDLAVLEAALGLHAAI